MSDKSLPAFPLAGEEPDGYGGTFKFTNEGMSLRDYFAGQALAGVNGETLYFGTVGKPHNPWPDVAKDCYRAADAMLEARKEL